MKWKIVIASTVFFCGCLAGYGMSFLFSRYKTQEVMIIPITELSTLDYPDDPAPLSSFYQRYGQRMLHLVKKEGTIFDFYFESKNPDVATITIFDVDLSLYVPSIPKWIKGDSSLEKIALVEREWNHQQVIFETNSPNLHIEGGDGFEKTHICSAELIRNSLNAGLWELQLFALEERKKVLYYHGWFSFPLGHYKNVFEKINNLSYWKHWHRLEHWFSPAMKIVDLKKMRYVVEEISASIVDTTHEKIMAKGEQLNKMRTLSAKSVLVWKDFPEKKKNVVFATFTPPGCYKVDRRWGNEYERISSLEQVIFRKIKTPASDNFLQEIECRYRNPENGQICRFIFSGFDLSTLPSLAEENYYLGYEMPLGISLPPAHQSYEDLLQSPPSTTPFFSFLLDEQNRWIDHRKAAIDGAILHKDINNSNLFHLYLLSYERHTLIAHYKFLCYTQEEM